MPSVCNQLTSAPSMVGNAAVQIALSNDDLPAGIHLSRV
jgi:hypothetical protein